MTRDKILLWLLYAAGLFSLGVFVITKNESLMEAATSHMFDGGDLYRFARVLHFRTEVPEELCADEKDDEADPDTCAVIVIGDSFMESCRGHERFPHQLAGRLGTSVCPVYAAYSPGVFDPVYFCWKNGLDPERKRTIILERVERYILPTFGNRKREDTAGFHQRDLSAQTTWWRTIRRRWFTDAEKNYEVLLKGSAISIPFMEAWNTARFALFGQISEETPVYSMDPPFLFDKEEVTPGMNSSFYYPHPDSVIDRIAKNIAVLRDSLASEYQADLVFMPIPNSYTLYHTLVNNDPYDDYLPRLYARLEAHGVRTIRLYERFRDSKEVLYFPTDTHWNGTGAGLAVDEAVRQLKTSR